MKRKLLFNTIAMLCFGGISLTGSNASAATPDGGTHQAIYQAAPNSTGHVAQVGLFSSEPGCGCETPCDCEPVGCDEGCCTEPDFGVDAMCGCDASCDGGCDSGCGCGSGLGLGKMLDGYSLGDCCLGDCCLGEPWALFGENGGFSAGGWIQMGYHSEANALFNSRPDEFQLHQAWLYAEKAIDTSCGFDIGGRIDYLYGTDSQDTQAFGTDPRGWDNDWDNGPDYGHALPQLYLEAGYGDFSVKAGHFYTIIGWEVVTAPDNFFYSHAYTMYNSEPFTHTGVLGTYNVTEDITAYGGYTFGWDSGFDDNGDTFLSGLSAAVTDDVTLTYASTVGRFGEARFNGVEKGYMQSLVADVSVSDKLQYIFQTDYLDTDNGISTVRETFGINQYLIYSINDCVSVGSRFEWWQVQKDSQGYYGDDTIIPANTGVSGNFDVYALTFGVNYKPHANVIIRPEIRGDWLRGIGQDELTAADNVVVSDGNGNKRDQTTFGIDTIFLF